MDLSDQEPRSRRRGCVPIGRLKGVLHQRASVAVAVVLLLLSLPRLVRWSLLPPAKGTVGLAGSFFSTRTTWNLVCGKEEEEKEQERGLVDELRNPPRPT